MFKKITCIVVSLAIVLASLYAIDCRATDLTTHHNDSFTFLHPTEKAELTSRYYYSDSYFTKSSLAYNPCLATMSMCMACAAVDGQDAATYSKEIESIFTKSGFSSIYVNEDYNKAPEKDTIGFIFAKKTIKEDDKDVPLVAINFRSLKYGKEWANNLDIGTDKVHAGFKISGDKVLAALESYLTEQNIDDRAKIWISGYSRGAGIANYVASRICKTHSVGDASFNQSDIYAYTFATPNITTGSDYKKSVYRNIYNIVSKYDLVTSIAPEQWGWHRYGKDVFLPDKFSDESYVEKKQNAQKYLNKFITGFDATTDTLPGYTLKYLSGDISIVPDGTVKDVSDIIDDIYSSLAESIGSNENYSELKPSMDAIVDVFFGATDEQMEALKNSLKEQVDENGMLYIMADLSSSGELTTQMIFKALDDAGIVLEDEETLRPNVQQLVKYLGTSLVSDLSVLLPDILTLYENLNPFISNHYYICYLAWLQSMDPNYAEIPTVTQSPTEAPVKLSKAKITKAKKQSSKKVKVILKKVKNATGYKFQFYKAKTTKAKKRVYTKTISKNKTTFTFKSKKLKTKKLYVRARAYSKKVSPTVYGSWSKLVKVKK